MEDKRIYAIVAATAGKVVQPAGRQVAQVAHVVSKLRLTQDKRSKFRVFDPVTTIVLQARDIPELYHIMRIAGKAGLNPAVFQDYNPKAYGTELAIFTAVAFYATPSENLGVSDYLPLWGS